jgi:hypothetical protein
MPFRLPDFNLTCNIWHAPAVPPGVPSLAVPCNLAFGLWTNQIFQIGLSPATSFMEKLLLPAGADVRATQSGSSDVAECPAGSGCYYHVLGVGDSGKGFPNEHRVALLQPTADYGLWPTPYP